jgi:autoinducer 2-degrading protein
MYAVIVNIRVKPGTAEAFLAACAGNHQGSRQEPGNLRWDVIRVQGEPDRFVLDELYRDEAAFKAHQQTPHFFAWRAAVADLMAEPRTASRGDVVLTDAG